MVDPPLDEELELDGELVARLRAAISPDSSIDREQHLAGVLAELGRILNVNDEGGRDGDSQGE